MVVIYVHKGNSDYLPYVLKMTRHFNPSLRIIFLGDDSNRHVANEVNAEFYPIHDYETSIPYYHQSVNPLEYEKFCFERWFIIHNFVKRHAIDRFVYSDSDNAIVRDITNIGVYNSGLGSKDVVVPNFLFIRTTDLTKILEFYMKLYTLSEPEFLKAIKPYVYTKFLESHKTLLYSDMFFLKQAFTELNISFIRLPELDAPLIFNSTFTKFPIEYRSGKFYRKDTIQQLVNIHFCEHNKDKARVFYESFILPK